MENCRRERAVKFNKRLMCRPKLDFNGQLMTQKRWTFAVTKKHDKLFFLLKHFIVRLVSILHVLNLIIKSV